MRKAFRPNEASGAKVGPVRPIHEALIRAYCLLWIWMQRDDRRESVQWYAASRQAGRERYRMYCTCTR
jgi:hypothetical protein